MTTLAEFMIISGADNRPPMLKKSMYDSWKSRMELYIENRENERMILNSVLNGLLVWPTVAQEDGTTRTKKYEELSVFKKLQADCDLKATNIVLQGLSPDVYAIFNHHKVSKDIWNRVKLLMQGTKLSLQERECKLYDEFDKFSFMKGGKARVVKCFNCQGEGLMDKQCTQPKRTRNAAWFKDNAMLAKAQESGQILNEEQLAFPADPGTLDGQVVLIANLSNYGLDFISEDPKEEPIEEDPLEELKEEG
nr:hypothetical protein [Tanacetum cinerariifolium]